MHFLQVKTLTLIRICQNLITSRGDQSFLLYLFSMIQDIHSHYPQENFDKYKANTPATADSLIMEPLSTEIFGSSEDKSNWQFKQEGTLFTLLEDRFEKKAEAEEDQKVLKNQPKIVVEQNIQQCEIRVGINILKEQGEVVKSFSKAIIKTKQFNDQIDLIFDRQYEKLKIETNTKYIIEVLLETLDGFSKSIWEQQFKLEENLKKWSVMTISCQSSEKCLNMEVQKVGRLVIKPLSLRLPLPAIDQFFDYKFKLLNKSELLNTLKSISELKGILLPLSKQNMGSRIIQKLLTKAKQDEVELVINELKNEFRNMIVDKYGNYVFQKIFKVASKSQKEVLMKKLEPFMNDLLKSKQGTHSIQALVDSLETEQVIQWFSSFSPQEIYDLSTNKFSMHFMVKLVKIIPREYLANHLIYQFSRLAVNKQGIVVLKCLLSVCSNDPQLRYEILAACQQCANQIAFCEFGHYIIEEMFNYYNFYELQNIINYLVMYICYFSQNQYSSSIVRIALEMYGDYISVPIINTILKSGLSDLMESSSGEFVLHRLMELTSDVEAKNLLMNEMMVLSKSVKCYEKRQKWLKFFKLI